MPPVMGFVVFKEDTMGEWWMWLGFFALVLTLLWVDLRFVGGGKSHKVSLKEAGAWSLVWVSMALLFNLAIWYWVDVNMGREMANQKGLEFLSGYLIEKALAVDNVFVWLMLFGYFAIPAELQRRVLLYGVLGAIVMRAGMVFAGSWLIEQFHWILYLFGAFLLLTGAKMLWAADKEPDLANNPLLNWMRRRFKVTEQLEGEHFFVWRDGVRFATPLLLILVLVEVSDLIFAVDSIPAIFAVTTDPFIVLTSNIFAIMGLRAMYFLLAGVAERFSLLKYGLAFILMFIGVKMLLLDIFKIPTGVALGVVASILVLSMGLSLWLTRKQVKSAS
jgi:tellurite resistance protein TerC